MAVFPSGGVRLVEYRHLQLLGYMVLQAGSSAILPVMEHVHRVNSAYGV